MRNLVIGAVALLASLAALPAMAGNVTFKLTDNLFGSTLSWSLPESPTPDSYDNGSFQIVGPVSGGAHEPDFGDADEAAFGNFSFFTGDDLGGFEMEGFALFPGFGGVPYSINTVGDQLFTGDTSAPTFTRGTFFLNNFEGDCGCSASFAVNTAAVSDYTLTIGGGIPEPAAWALMIVGFGATGLVLRRRQTAAA